MSKSKLNKEELELGNHANYKGILLIHDNSDLKVYVKFKNLVPIESMRCAMSDAKGKHPFTYLDEVLDSFKKNGIEVAEVIKENSKELSNHPFNMMMYIAIKGQENWVYYD